VRGEDRLSVHFDCDQCYRLSGPVGRLSRGRANACAPNLTNDSARHPAVASPVRVVQPWGLRAKWPELSRTGYGTE
jgi:hypothetical protein